MKNQDLQILAMAALNAPVHIPGAAVPVPNLAAQVDRLGILRAVIAQAEKEAEAIRAELEAAGLQRIEGNFYRATITQCAGRMLTDWRTIAERFKPSRQLIAAHTKQGAESTRLTVTACKITH